MKKIMFSTLLFFLLMFPFYEAQSATISLNALTPETGSNLDTEPLFTPYGTIRYNGFLTSGVFWHDFFYPVPYSEFLFDFDVNSLEFRIGGAMGGIYTEALDINDSVVDSYHTLDFAVGQYVTLSGSGIRRFTFVDGRLTGGQSEVWDVVLTTSASVVPEPISIEIKPSNDDLNSINLKSKGLIPVAILTTEDFDAATVDPLSVAFGPDGTMEVHGKGHIEDVDGDGYLDLMLHFRIQETGIACGDIEAGLTGETFDGQAVEGFDFINILKCK